MGATGGSANADEPEPGVDDVTSTDFLPLDDESNDSDAEDSPNCGDDNSDSGSDISMDADSEEEEDDNDNNGTLPTAQENRPLLEISRGNPAPPETGLSRKRKSPENSLDNARGETSLSSEPVKKVKLDGDHEPGVKHQSQVPWNRSVLPAEVWHHIFTFCPPRTLGSMLSVNKLFNVYLDPSSSISVEPPSSSPGSTARTLKPNAIWQASRRLFWPHMPAPLQDKTELDMWRLSCSPSCPSCGKRSPAGLSYSIDQWRPGPGVDGVAAVWQFGIRRCGQCLLSQSKKVCFVRVASSLYLIGLQELDLLLSSTTPSALMPALPFIFMTQELQALSPTTLERGDLPPNTSLTKIFWSPDVESVTEEFEVVRKLGSAATEEWLKGLDGRRRERQNDSARWENWAASGAIIQMQTLLYPGYQPRSLEDRDPSVLNPDIGNPSNDHSSLDSSLGSIQPNPTSTSQGSFPLTCL